MKSLRLESIASLVSYDTVFDVGADHGELEVILSKNKNIVKIYAIENKKGPFEALKQKVKDNQLEKVETIYSSGIKDLPMHKLSLVIAGIGGINIVNILLEYKENLNYAPEIILAPHSDYEILRRVMATLGYRIDKEVDVTENDKDYLITRFVKGSVDYTQNEYAYGIKGEYHRRKRILELKRSNENKKSKQLADKIRRMEDEN